MTDFDRQALHQFLTGRYDLEGLKTLCHYLDVDYDNLDGRTKDALARELVRYMERVGRVGELVGLQVVASTEVEPSRLNRRIHKKTGIELIRIPAGEFICGYTAEKLSIRNENPQRTIELPEYWIGRTPVTNAQYKRFLDANLGHRIPNIFLGGTQNWDKKLRTYPTGTSEHPIVNVDFF